MRPVTALVDLREKYGLLELEAIYQRYNVLEVAYRQFGL